MTARLPVSAHTARPWRIHELARGFRVEDVWALPCHGGLEEFPRLIALVAGSEGTRRRPPAVRALFALRHWIGDLFGWDDDDARDAAGSLLERLPADLRDTPHRRFGGPFSTLYELPDEFAAETANRTVHAILHLGWVPDGAGSHRGQMAVLVAPRGRLGAAYMVAIRPFRHLIVYPALLRGLERSWQAPRRP